ncbi:MAG: AMP-binding protein [Pseudomonadota bacterium]
MERPDWPPHEGLRTIEQIEAQPLKHWLRGHTVPEVIAAAAQNYGEAVAHRFLSTPDAEPIDTTFNDLQSLSEVAASPFASLGPSPVVASLLPALPATLPLAFGAMQAGIYMPINPMLTPDAIGQMLARAQADVLLCPSDIDADRIDQISQHRPELAVTKVPDIKLEVGSVFAGWGLSGGAPKAPMPKDVAAYVHTGGTTGAPKIARLSHANLAFMAFLAAFGGGMREGDVMPCGMPLFHVGGLVFGGLAPIAAGGRIVQLGKDGFRDPAMRSALPAVANREAATLLFAPPTIAIDVLGTTEPNPFASARHWVSSAAPLPKATHEAFTRHTGLQVKEAWGMTEATLVLSFMPPGGETRVGSVGQRLPFCELCIVDQQTKNLLPSGQTGLILARSPGVFAGYVGADDDGLVEGPDGQRWLDTGDLGTFDEDGFLTITGRAKDMILRGGHNIDPGIIEAAYLAHPDVSAAIAVGKPDARVGEVPIVFLTGLPGVSLDADAICAEVNPAISDPVARPRDVVVLATLPLTTVGKPDKPALRREATRIAVAQIVETATSIDVKAGEGGALRVALHPLTHSDASQVRSLGLDVEEAEIV